MPSSEARPKMPAAIPRRSCSCMVSKGKRSIHSTVVDQKSIRRRIEIGSFDEGMMVQLTRFDEIKVGRGMHCDGMLLRELREDWLV